MHTYSLQRQNQQVNRRHIKITYLLTAPEPARGHDKHKRACQRLPMKSDATTSDELPTTNTPTKRRLLQHLNCIHI